MCWGLVSYELKGGFSPFHRSSILLFLCSDTWNFFDWASYIFLTIAVLVSRNELYIGRMILELLIYVVIQLCNLL